MEFPAPFFFADKRLIDYTIKIINVLNSDLCELMCYQEPNCVSFNLKKKTRKWRGKTQMWAE